MQYAFSGYSALSVLFFAALFWKRSTKWGALAVALWVTVAVAHTATTPGALAWFGLMPVVPMTLIAAGADGGGVVDDEAARAGDAGALQHVLIFTRCTT